MAAPQLGFHHFHPSGEPGSDKSGLARFGVELAQAARKHSVLGSGLNALQGLAEVVMGKPMDDRKLLLEYGVTLLQSLPEGSDTGTKIASGLIGKLWSDLPHPPRALVGPEQVYRQPDGRNNNFVLPDLGRSGQPYARNVPPVRPKPTNLPDPSLVFDQLMRRPDTSFKPHPSGLSSFFFAFATIVIHECFQTSATNHHVNDTTSYVDLSTLYGNNLDEQLKIRCLDGSGRILPDAISSPRILLLPPASVAILVLFSRNHNEIVDTLLQLNERKKYKPLEELTNEEPDDGSKSSLMTQDDDLFNKARNINVGWFAATVLHDYVAAILNSVRADTNWWLDLGGEIKQKDGTRLDRGGGNVVSTEFNILYRWHQTLSQKDASWIEKVLKDFFPNQDITDLNPAQFIEMARSKAAGLDSLNWGIPGVLDRDPETKLYRNEQIAAVIKDAVNEPAGAFGPRQNPAALKIVDVMGMLASRNTWNVCTLNEFRAFLNLKKLESFDEWSTNPEVARAAEKLYHNIDDLELYPGLVAEDAKPSMPGSGVCPGQTVGRAILDDAVSLIRSDRFFTVDWNTDTLTSWGLASLVPAGGARGGVFPTLILKHLPYTFPVNSTYALLPFYTQVSAKQIVTDLGIFTDYDTNRDPAPRSLIGITTLKGCLEAMADTTNLRLPYSAWSAELTGGHSFGENWHKHTPATGSSARIQTAFEAQQVNMLRVTADMFRTALETKQMIVRGPTRQVDIVRDVINVVPVEFIAQLLSIPIKRNGVPGGLCTLEELRLNLVTIFEYASFNVVPEDSFRLREQGRKAAKELLTTIASHLSPGRAMMSAAQDFVARSADVLLNRGEEKGKKFIERTVSEVDIAYGAFTRLGQAAAQVVPAVEGASDLIARRTCYTQTPESRKFYAAVNASGLTPTVAAAQVLGLAAAFVGNTCRQTALIIDYFLQPERAGERQKLGTMAHESVSSQVHEYCREAIRLAPATAGLARTAVRDCGITDAGRSKTKLRNNDVVLLMTSLAGLEDSAQVKSTDFDARRPDQGLGRGVAYSAMPYECTVKLVKSFFSLKSVQRAPCGGQLARVEKTFCGGQRSFYLDEKCAMVPAPYSLSVHFDA